jgi:dipeptidyl aminopeptidase/acylaminoacyl peptidase
MLKLFKSLLMAGSVLVRMSLRKKHFPVITILLITNLLFLGLYTYNSLLPDQKNVSTEKIFCDEFITDSADMKLRTYPSISPDGRYIAYNNVIVEGRDIKDVDIAMYDRKEGKSVELPGVNSKGWDLSPSLSGDGRFIVFQSNRTGKHFWNIYLYDTKEKKFIDIPGLNSFLPDINPSISADGNLITFASVRTARLEIYLYDRSQRKVTPVPAF